MIEAIIIILFFACAYLIYNFIAIKKKAEKYILPKSIKENYSHTIVPTDALNILTRDYFENEDIGGLVGANQYKEVHKYVSVITYDNFYYRGEKHFFKSAPIELSNTEIKEKLKEIKDMIIYFDSDDLSKHYFDLSFLM